MRLSLGFWMRLDAFKDYGFKGAGFQIDPGDFLGWAGEPDEFLAVLYGHFPAAWIEVAGSIEGD